MMGDGNIYEKAREYAKGFTQLLLNIKAVRCAKKEITTAKDIFTNKNDIKSILKRKGINPAEEMLKNQTEMELLQYSLEKGREIKEAVQMVSEKLERKVTQNELEKILRWVNEDVELEIICDWLCSDRSYTINGFDVTINTGKQGKHIIGDNNYIEGRSIFLGTVEEAQELVDQFAGKGEWIGTNKERINFGKIIGKYVNPITGETIETTVGIIHYSKIGTHIVPANPMQ